MARQDRRVLRGRLTTRVVTQEAMRHAIKDLLSDTKRYTIIAHQKRFNWRTGKTQDPVAIINDGEPLALSVQLDPRLRYARRVVVLLVQDDGGVGKVDLTLRTWESWSSMPSLTERMLSFNRSLLEGACTRLANPSLAILALIAPVLLSLAAFMSWALSTPANRHVVFDTSSKAESVIMPRWLTDFASISFYLWPLFIILAAITYLIYGKAGSLRVWPDSFTSTSISRAIFNFRKDFIVAKSASSIVIGIAIAILALFFTKMLVWFVHYVP
jgi:hypothetical protein